MGGVNYEGWHVEFTAHARRRMHERLVDEADVLAVVHGPDSNEPNMVHGGRLAARYLPQWDRILVVAIEEHPGSATVMVKTVLGSRAS